MYQKIVGKFGSSIVIERDGVRVSFTEDPANTDYQKYLAWVADGNNPETVSE